MSRKKGFLTALFRCKFILYLSRKNNIPNYFIQMLVFITLNKYKSCITLFLDYSCFYFFEKTISPFLLIKII